MSQYGQDQFILKQFSSPGFYIEAGATDGVLQSNTLLLEQNGWKGILVEPNSNFLTTLKQNRPNAIIENCALVANDYKLDYIEGNFNTTSVHAAAGCGVTPSHKNTEYGNVKVPAKTLSYLLDKNNINKIDFLSIDVEGYEIEALLGLDFYRYTPTFLLFEVHWGYPNFDGSLPFNGDGKYYRYNFLQFLRERNYILEHTFTNAHLLFKHKQ